MARFIVTWFQIVHILSRLCIKELLIHLKKMVFKYLISLQSQDESFSPLPQSSSDVIYCTADWGLTGQGPKDLKHDLPQN